MKLDVIDLGQIDYAAAWKLQQERADRVRTGKAPPTLFLLEHPPVITIGRRAAPGNILFPRERLQAMGVTVTETNRGGDVTFHGPGQVVAYPILNLAQACDLKRFLWGLEETMIRVTAEYGLSATRIPGCTGAWVGQEKIGAIGIRLERWVTLHGFAYNVNLNLDYFRLIIPCGIKDKGVTSLYKLLGREIPIQDVKHKVAHHFSNVFRTEIPLWPPAPHPVAQDCR